MKNLFLLLTLSLFALNAHSQRFVYVDTEYVLSKMPAYDAANSTIDSLAQAWQQDINDRQLAVEEMNSQFQKNEYLMTEQQKVVKQAEIDDARKAARAMQSSRFGFKGDLFKKRQELIKPLQDQIYAAIKKMAEQRGYDFVFDKTTGVSILYAKSSFDMSEELLRVVEGMN